MTSRGFLLLLLATSLAAVQSRTIESTSEYINCQNDRSSCTRLYARGGFARRTAIGAARIRHRAQRSQPDLARPHPLPLTRGASATLAARYGPFRRHLNSRGLTGTIPSEMGQLTALTFL